MTDSNSEIQHEGLGHVVPVSTLLAVFAALIVLTYITVFVSTLDVGRWSLWVALAVATAKGSLVVLYFMHLRYDSPFNAFIFATALVFLGLFLGIVLLDSIEYQPDIEMFLRNQG
ncbi:MAG: caa(3)-type oxidase subunit IV [Planctomycetes bacterium]|nr:caa(3)-type oxidase subunit IV [Planctomycetota bacterium]